MDLCEQIVAERDAGITRCGIRTARDVLLPDAAMAFGLFDAIRHEVDVHQARAILIHVLHRDLAYGCVAMPPGRAEQLAIAFLARVNVAGARFFCNATFGEGRLRSWNPATTSTFDTGILVLAPELIACLWVEDED